MNITGNRNQIEFDLENGYKITAEGEMLVNKTFVVFKHTLQLIEPPNNKMNLTQNQIEKLINEVQKNKSKDTVQIIFE